MSLERRHSRVRPAWFGPASLRGLSSTEGRSLLAVAPALTSVDSQLELRRVNRSEVRGMLEDNYRNFAPAVDRLKAQLKGLEDPMRHPRRIGGEGYLQPDGYDGTGAYRIQSEDPFDSREYVVRLVFAPDEEDYTQRLQMEEKRYAALERGLFIDPRYRDRVEHIVSADPDSYITVTELIRAKPVLELSAEKKESISVDPVREARDTAIAMADCGIMPEPNSSNTLITTGLDRFKFVDYQSINDWEEIDPATLAMRVLWNFNMSFTWWRAGSDMKEQQLFDLVREYYPQNI